MPWIGAVPAVVEAWYPGQQDGSAIASILFGDVNPSGRLPVTFPSSSADVPAATIAQWPGLNGKVLYSEGLNVGYRWYDARNIQPLFPFGYGLSYTRFTYSNLALVLPKSGSGNVATFEFTVSNSGSRPGAEVAQLYVSDPAGTGEPPEQLKGFRRIFLKPGESRQVTLTLTYSDLAQWDTAVHAWTVVPGQYRVDVGSSSRDIRLTRTITVP